MKSRRVIKKYTVKLFFSLLACVIGLGCLTTVEAADWPNWRGPNHNGISNEKGWSTNWPEAGPKKLWEKTLGPGFASMTIA
ncbi:MAG: hypothetical protein GWN67_27390, partial [Phycisphaerae bacterium]|nr:hypothetical protein [Phycisphaerae bacterium]NIS54450.1 hypothetical protein [Phycisphaerae bacterium]NIU12090.1 hypothetical protein [Phycisphaerae bacterium]NIU59949.1 hypothetical protein [Phycisphaerae bacterium]NIV00527.1 hypothetical protein [Phycisphaerae bacterium]